MVLELYVDPLSQPARALMFFVRAAKIEVDEKHISIQKGEHKTDAYKKVNRFGKIPAIVHDDFHLAESVAILRYLARTYKVAEHWYPTKDSRAQARVDEYMAWQHLGLRMPTTRYILCLLKPEALGDVTISDKEITAYKKGMEAAMDQMETIWLVGSKFIHGDQISIADLLALGEIEMTRLIQYNPRTGRPKLAAYLDRVKDTLGAQMYDEVQKTLYAATEMFKPKFVK